MLERGITVNFANILFVPCTPVSSCSSAWTSTPLRCHGRNPVVRRAPSVSACAQKPERRNDTVLYFAYFSNLNPSKLGPNAAIPGRRCDVRQVERVALHGYRLVFNVPGLPLEPAFANIERAPGYTVKGALFTLSEADFQSVARSENVASYNSESPFFLSSMRSVFPRACHIDVVVEKEDGSHVKARTFSWVSNLLPNVVRNFARPSRRYVQSAIDGARYRGIDSRYINSVLSKIKTQSGPLGSFDLFFEPRPHPFDKASDASDRKSNYYSPFSELPKNFAREAFRKDDFIPQGDNLRLLPLTSDARLPEDRRMLYFIPGIDGTGRSILRHVDGLEQAGFFVCSVVYPHGNRQNLFEVAGFVWNLITEHAAGRQINIAAESMGALVLMVAVAKATRPEMNTVEQSNFGCAVLINPAISFSSSSLAPLCNSLVGSAGLSDGVYQVGLGPILIAIASDISVLKPPFELSRLMRAKDILLTMGAFSEILPREALRHRLGLLQSYSLTSRDFEIIRNTFSSISLICAENDKLLPNIQECSRLRREIPGLKVAVLPYGGHTILQDPRFSLANFVQALCPRLLSTKRSIPSSSHVRNNALHKRREALLARFAQKPTERAGNGNKAPTATDMRRFREYVADSYAMFSPVFVGVERIPAASIGRPIIFVSNHTLLPLYDALFVIDRILQDRRVLLKSLASRLVFLREEGFFIPGAKPFTLNEARRFGVVSLSPRSFTAQLANNEWTLLFPGGARESLKQKADKPYSLHWPDSPEFVRSAALFGALIVPLSTVGSEDMVRLLVDGPELRPFAEVFVNTFMSKSLEEVLNISAGAGAKLWKGKGSDDDITAIIPPIGVPKALDRLYFRFGQPIEVPPSAFNDARVEMEVYESVKRSVECGVQVLLERRKFDAFRSPQARTAFALTHGATANPPASPAWPWSDGKFCVLGEDMQPPIQP